MIETNTWNFVIYEKKFDDDEQPAVSYLQFRPTGYVFAEFADLPSARRAREIASHLVTGPVYEPDEDIISASIIRDLLLATEFVEAGFEDDNGNVVLKHGGETAIKFRGK